MVFCIMRRFISLYSVSEEGIRHLPVLPAAVFAVGPLGWLLVMLLSGAFLLLKDVRFPSRPLNAIFTAILALLDIGIIFAVMPFDTNSSSIGEGMEQ